MKLISRPTLKVKINRGEPKALTQNITIASKPYLPLTIYIQRQQGQL